MKKYYWALSVFFVIIYVVPNLIMSANTNTGSWITKFDGILAVLVLSIFTIFVIKKCTNDLTLALFSVLLFFSSFWHFSLIPVDKLSTLGIWSSLTNFLALGAYFMASREDRFSFQRISLLILCGIFTFGSLIINGFNPFFFSIIVASIYMIIQKRYLDMFLMAILIAIITILLLFIQSYLHHGTIWGNAQRYFTEIVNYWKDFFYSSRIGVKEILRQNIIIITLGIAPIIIFFYASYRGYRNRAKEIFSRDIYKFSLIFLICSIAFALLNKGLSVASLPITYIPFAFLVATGLVNYLRMSNRIKSLKNVIAFAGIVSTVIGVNLAIFNDFNIAELQSRVGLSMLIAGPIMISCIKFGKEYAISAYFLSFSIIVNALATYKL